MTTLAGIDTLWQDKFVGLNAGQQDALLKLIEFSNPDNPALFFVLRGYAGTGKTHMLGRFAQGMIDIGQSKKVMGTATTNKATKVLRSKMPIDCVTIYSALGLRVSEDDEQPRLLSMEETESRRQMGGTCVIVDESSMITKELLGHIRKFAENFSVKFIFVGDPAQLPPVEKGEGVDEGLTAISPVWDLEDEEMTYTAELTEIVRYDGPIEKLADNLRDLIFTCEDKSGEIDLRIGHEVVAETRSGVFAVGVMKFDDWMVNAATKGLFLEDDAVVALAFTNAQVSRYNNQIRRAMFGPDVVTPYHQGERIVMTKPFYKGTDERRTAVARNRDEFRVDSVREQLFNFSHNQGDATYRILLLTTVEGVELPVLHPESKELFEQQLAILGEVARKETTGWKKKVAWKDFWEHHGVVAHIEYAYAMTTHCSQGGTYKTVFVDVNNIMGVRRSPLRTRLMSLYVAVTRAAHSVIVN